MIERLMTAPIRGVRSIIDVTKTVQSRVYEKFSYFLVLPTALACAAIFASLNENTKVLSDVVLGVSILSALPLLLVCFMPIVFFMG
jgi:hypothetical protein